MEAMPSPSSFLTLSKTLSSTHSHRHRCICASSTSPPLTRSLCTNRVSTRQLGSTDGLSKSALSASLAFMKTAVPPVRCVSSSVASFASAGGGNGGGDGGGGRGDGSEGGDSKVGEVLGGNEDVSALSAEVVVLDVGGMSCGGCAAKVKKILESQPQVSSANVILATGIAIVWPVVDAKLLPNWRQEVGEMLAKHLTSCGFESKLQGQGENDGQIPK